MDKARRNMKSLLRVLTPGVVTWQEGGTCRGHGAVSQDLPGSHHWEVLDQGTCTLWLNKMFVGHFSLLGNKEMMFCAFPSLQNEGRICGTIYVVQNSDQREASFEIKPWKNTLASIYQHSSWWLWESLTLAVTKTTVPFLIAPTQPPLPSLQDGASAQKGRHIFAQECSDFLLISSLWSLSE